MTTHEIAQEIFNEVRAKIEKHKQSLDKESATALDTFLKEKEKVIIEGIEESIYSEEELHKKIEQTLKENFPDEDPEEIEKNREYLKQIYIQGKTIGEAMGFDAEQMDALYTQGYYLYNNGLYDEAKKYFTFLTYLDGRNPAYLFVAGASFHMLKNYESAIDFYSLSAFFDWQNPLPWYHLADCYIQIRDYPQAIKALENVMSRSKNIKAYQKIFERAQILLDMMPADSKGEI